MSVRSANIVVSVRALLALVSAAAAGALCASSPTREGLLSRARTTQDDTRDRAGAGQTALPASGKRDESFSAAQDESFPASGEEQAPLILQGQGTRVGAFSGKNDDARGSGSALSGSALGPWVPGRRATTWVQEEINRVVGLVAPCGRLWSAARNNEKYEVAKEISRVAKLFCLETHAAVCGSPTTRRTNNAARRRESEYVDGGYIAGGASSESSTSPLGVSESRFREYAWECARPGRL